MSAKCKRTEARRLAPVLALAAAALPFVGMLLIAGPVHDVPAEPGGEVAERGDAVLEDRDPGEVPGQDGLRDSGPSGSLESERSAGPAQPPEGGDGAGVGDMQPLPGSPLPAFFDASPAWELTGCEAQGEPKSWTYLARESLENAASNLLVSLRDRGGELVSAGYLDLFGDAWGCAYRAADDAGSLVATLYGDADAAEGTDAQTRVHIVEVSLAGLEEAAR